MKAYQTKSERRKLRAKLKSNIINNQIPKYTEPQEVTQPDVDLMILYDGSRISDRFCCKKAKNQTAYFRPIGELNYYLCAKHFDLEFFRKHQIVWGKNNG